MSRKSLQFILILGIVLILVISLHLLVLNAFELPLWDHKILLSYVVNFVLAVLVLAMVEMGMRNKSAQGGFIFMAGSALKFLVFFLVFFPPYKKDGVMETAEFITFFVPYTVCLVMEVYYLSKRLNNQES